MDRLVDSFANPKTLELGLDGEIVQNYYCIFTLFLQLLSIGCLLLYENQTSFHKLQL